MQLRKPDQRTSATTAISHSEKGSWLVCLTPGCRYVRHLYVCVVVCVCLCNFGVCLRVPGLQSLHISTAHKLLSKLGPRCQLQLLSVNLIAAELQHAAPIVAHLWLQALEVRPGSPREIWAQRCVP